MVGYKKIELKRRKRIVPTKTIICTSEGTIAVDKYLKKEDLSGLPGLKGIAWEYKGKIVSKSWGS